MEYLFVYGTLIKEDNNNMSDFLSKHAELYSRGFFYGELYDLGEYPGAIISNNFNDKVYGTIYTLSDPDNLFKVLDEYEEVGNKYPVPNEYKRIKIKAYSIINEQIFTWIYLYNRSIANLPRIYSGDYIKYKNLRR